MLQQILAMFTITEIATDVIRYVLRTIGYFLLFGKLGMRRREAFIPQYRFYKMAERIGMKEEGRTAALISCFLYGVSLILQIFTEKGSSILSAQAVSYLMLIGLLLVFITLIYKVRVYRELCDVFHAGKKYVVLWFLFEGITAIFWSLNSRIQPDPALMHEPETAAPLYNHEVEVIQDGLSVNLKSRTVGFGWNQRALLRDIHLNIPKGNMVLLLGGSGAGKTTFVNALTGYEKADAKICLNGDDVYHNFDQMKFEIGFVPQQDTMRYQDTVYRTLADSSDLRLPTDVSSSEQKKRIDEVLKMFGLMPVRRNLVGKQSGGQKKRISIAMEFIADPYLFVLDEPDSGLDGVMAKDLMRRLQGIARQGKIVIVITHTPDRVIEYFDKVIVLAKDANRSGRLAFYGPIEEAKHFFGRQSMEDIVKTINRKEEGGDGRADELIAKFEEGRNGTI